MNKKFRAATILFAASALAGCGLLPKRSDKNADRPAHLAARTGDIQALANIIRSDPEQIERVDSKNNTALHVAILRDHLEAAQLLIAAGAPINAQNNRGLTTLMCAAERGNLDVVKLLLKRHADTRLQDTQGWTALKWAKKSHHYRYAMIIALAEARQ